MTDALVHASADEVPNLFAVAVKHHQAGRANEAIALYQRIISLAPELAEVHGNLGAALAGLGRWDEAEPSLRRAISLKPDAAELHGNLATVLLKLGRPHEAIGAARQAIALKPGFAEAYSNLGTALAKLGRPDEAEAAVRRAIAAKPKFAEGHYNLGNGLFDQGRLEEAVSCYRTAVALRPDLAEGHYNLGNGLFDQGRLEDAVACYRTAIALRPDLADAYNNLGVALKELGRVREACEATERAISLAPRQPKYFRGLGEVRRFVAGEPCLTALEELARDADSLSVPDRTELNFALAKAYEDLGDYARAFDRLLTGNALKRRQIAYPESTILDGLKRVEAVFTSELIERRRNAGEPSALPIFIVGMLRSGSSLVEQIVASHPHAFGAGELKHFGKAAERLRSPEGDEFPAAVARMSDDELRRFGAAYLAEIGRLAPDAKRIVNKMPANYILAGLIHLTLPNAAIIHTFRDPADTCVSCFSKLFTEEQNYTYDLAELGRYHRHYQSLMAHWHRVLPPGRILDVRYEDVVADLEGTARRIVAHCGLEWSPRCLDFHRTERPVRTASAVQVRQPIYANAVGRWRVYEPFLAPLLAELRT